MLWSDWGRAFDSLMTWSNLLQVHQLPPMYCYRFHVDGHAIHLAPSIAVTDHVCMKPIGISPLAGLSMMLLVPHYHVLVYPVFSSWLEKRSLDSLQDSRNEEQRVLAGASCCNSSRDAHSRREHQRQRYPWRRSRIIRRDIVRWSGRSNCVECCINIRWPFYRQLRTSSWFHRSFRYRPSELVWEIMRAVDCKMQFVILP